MHAHKDDKNDPRAAILNKRRLGAKTNLGDRPGKTVRGSSGRKHGANMSTPNWPGYATLREDIRLFEIETFAGSAAPRTDDEQ